MNLSQDNTPPEGRNAGAVPVWGPAQAAPAHPSYTVGAVGFGPSWTVEDAMAASIVRLEQELDEANARVAVLEEEQKILAKGCKSCGVAWDAHLGIAGTCEALRQAVEERDEARDTVLRLRKQRAIARNFGETMERERDEARLQYRSTLALAEALAKTQVELKAERDEARALLERKWHGESPAFVEGLQ